MNKWDVTVGFVMGSADKSSGLLNSHGEITVTVASDASSEAREEALSIVREMDGTSNCYVQGCVLKEDYSMETYDSLIDEVGSELREMQSDLEILKRYRGDNGMGGYTNAYLTNLKAGQDALEVKIQSLSGYIGKHIEP